MTRAEIVALSDYAVPRGSRARDEVLAGHALDVARDLLLAHDEVEDGDEQILASALVETIAAQADGR